MNINISVRHEEVTEQTKLYTYAKIQKLEKYRLQRVEVVMVSEGEKYKIEVVAFPSSRGNQVVASALADDWYSAIDQASDKAERQLRKYKEKITSHRVKKYKPEPPSEETEPFYDQDNDQYGIGPL